METNLFLFFLLKSDKNLEENWKSSWKCYETVNFPPASSIYNIFLAAVFPLVFRGFLFFFKLRGTEIYAQSPGRNGWWYICYLIVILPFFLFIAAQTFQNYRLKQYWLSQSPFAISRGLKLCTACIVWSRDALIINHDTNGGDCILLLEPLLESQHSSPAQSKRSFSSFSLQAHFMLWITESLARSQNPFH